MTLEPCARCGRDHPPGPCLDGGGAGRSLLPLPFDLLAGAKVGEYQVTGLLGQGGMGVVYSGIHPLLGRKVAIKVLSQQMARRSEATARFLQEARAASTLHHQNIVDVFAFGELADGRYYQVMELLEGESLRFIMNRRGPLTRQQARIIITGVLSGLGAAHRRGVVHRDIKPDNVFICGPLDGPLSAADIKILDFGLAKRESAQDISIKTRTGVTMGTPAYMSPEQCRGIAAIDGRTDIYAAGVLLFEMIAGRTPFQSESAFDLMVMQINVRPPRLARLTGRAEPFERVILKALGKRPEERFETASAMLAAVDAAVPPGSPADAPGPALADGGDVRTPTPARPRDFAQRATLVSAGLASDGEAPALAPAGAAAATTERLWWRRRGLPQIAVGVTLGLLVIAVSVFLSSRRPRSADAPPADPAGATAATAILPLAPPTATSARAEEAAVPAPVVAPARKQRARPAAAKKVGGAGNPAAGDDRDLEVPLNPYAR